MQRSTENIQWFDIKKKLCQDHFENAKNEFEKWLLTCPTGEFSLIIIVNQGGIRGKPKITKKQDL